MNPEQINETGSLVYKPQEIQYEDGLETNIVGIVEQICARKPQNPCSIQLIMDHEVETGSNELDEFEFDLLRSATLAFINCLFGTSQNPMKLQPAQFELLNQYMHSIGYHILIKKEETETTYRMTMNFQSYDDYHKNLKPNPLEHLRSQMA